MRTRPAAPQHSAGTEPLTSTRVKRWLRTGNARVGSTLKASKSGWAKGTTLKYRWLRNGVPITGA